MFKGLTKFKWDDIGQQHALVTKYTHNESSDAETVVVKQTLSLSTDFLDMQNEETCGMH